jgi:hypothetical protein
VCVALRIADQPNPLEDAIFWAGHRLALLLPPETAHKIGVLAADYKLFPKSHLRARMELATRVWGLDFKSPIGLAAGFTKDAQVLLLIERLRGMHRADENGRRSYFLATMRPPGH